MIAYHATVGKYADTFCLIALSVLLLRPIWTYTVHTACFANATQSNGIPITLALHNVHYSPIVGTSVYYAMVQPQWDHLYSIEKITSIKTYI
jgi:hypothetical protein